MLTTSSGALAIVGTSACLPFGVLYGTITVLVVISVILLLLLPHDHALPHVADQAGSLVAVVHLGLVHDRHRCDYR